MLRGDEIGKKKKKLIYVFERKSKTTLPNLAQGNQITILSVHVTLQNTCISLYYKNYMVYLYLFTGLTTRSFIYIRSVHSFFALFGYNNILLRQDR